MANPSQSLSTIAYILAGLTAGGGITGYVRHFPPHLLLQHHHSS